jgi:hypothetical protein
MRLRVRITLWFLGCYFIWIIIYKNWPSKPVEAVGFVLAILLFMPGLEGVIEWAIREFKGKGKDDP